MKPSSYWQKRFEQLKRDELLATNGSLAETRKLYDRIEKSIEKDLAYWYGRYLKNNGGVSYQDAQKALSKKELAEFRWTVEEYIEKAKSLELSSEWHKALENASIKAHVTRLESLQLQLRHHSEVLHDTLNKNLGKDLRKVYEGQYYKNLFEIQKGLGQGRLIEALDPSFLDLVIHKPWHKDGLDFSSRVWQARDKLIHTLEQELTYIAIRGDSPDGAIRRISQLFGKSRSHSAMLVQTEHAALASRAQQDAFKALDVEEFEYIATLDGKTSELCQSMDGKHFPMSEYQVGLTAPPLHPRCRSCTAPYFEDMEAPRWARDKDGKGYVIGEDLRYNEWEAIFVQKRDKPHNIIAGLQPKVERNSRTLYNKSIRKNVTVDDFSDLKLALKEAFGKDTKVKEEVVDAIYDSLNKFNGLNLYTGIKVKSLSKEIIFQTNTIQHGNWSINEFIINRTAIEGMDVNKVNRLFKDGKNTVCNSLEDGVYHEYMHALIASKLTFSHYERLCETKGIKGISDTADKDLAEMIAEIGVLRKQGNYDIVPEECKRIFEEEMGDLL